MVTSSVRLRDLLTEIERWQAIFTMSGDALGPAMRDPDLRKQVPWRLATIFYWTGCHR